MKISNKIMKIIYAISVIVIILIIFIWTNNGLFFSKGMNLEATLFQTILIVIAAFLGAIFLLYLGILYKISTSIGKVWFLLGVGMATWAIGEIFYTYFQLFTSIPPFPSVADIFYISAYLPLIAGLIIQMFILQIKLPILDKVIITIAYAAISIFIVVFVIILPVQSVYPMSGTETFDYALGALYPILDLVLLLCILVVFAKLRHGKINLAWILLLIGFFCVTVADIVFNWIGAFHITIVLFESYDLLFLIGYILILVGVLSVISLMTKTFETT